MPSWTAINAEHYGLLRVLRAAGKVTIQDLGRRGWQHLGVCESGAADEHAFGWANRLLGNTESCAVLEITLGQVTVEFTVDSVFCVTGGDTQILLNGQTIPLWQSTPVAAGAQLKISLPRTGLLNYLAVQGGFLARPVCGSRSQCEREGLGPMSGHALIAGQSVGYLGVASTDCNLNSGSRSLIPQEIPEYKACQSLAFFAAPKYQQALLAAGFYEHYYSISADANRMGYRLTGPAVPLNAGEQVSNGVALGAVQLPPNGQPIILLKDRQTMGGYPVLGCISRASTSVLAQMRPGQKIKFKPEAL